MLNLESYEAYFESDIVGKYTKLRSFYHIDMFDFDSFVNDLRGGIIKVPVLAMESYEVATVARKNDNIHNSFKGAITILNNFNVRTKTQINKTAFLAEIEKMMFQVRFRMLEDSKNACHILYGLLPESMIMQKTETLDGGFSGYRMTLEIAAPDETAPDENWI